MTPKSAFFFSTQLTKAWLSQYRYISNRNGYFPSPIASCQHSLSRVWAKTMWLGEPKHIPHTVDVHHNFECVMIHITFNPPPLSKLIELKYHKGHLWDYLCARMLLEPLRPEECNTIKTTSLQRKKDKKIWNCDLLYAVSVIFGIILFVLSVSCV